MTTAAGYAAWFTVGAAYGLAVAGALSIGILILPLPVVGTVLLARHPVARQAWPGVIAGPSVLLLLLAYLNRSGPGTVCSTTATRQSCVDETSPWPFLLLALVLPAVAVTVAAVRRRSTR